MDGDEWEKEETKFKDWKTIKKGSWDKWANGKKKRPMWIVWAPCGPESSPIEVSRGWEGPEEMFKAMNFCNAGYIYKPNDDCSMNDTPMEECDKILSTTLEGYKKPGKHKAKNGAGWPCIGLVKYKMQGKNQVKILGLRLIDDSKSSSTGNPYKKKGTKMEMTTFLRKFKAWDGIGLMYETGPMGLTTENLDMLYDKHDRQ